MIKEQFYVELCSIARGRTALPPITEKKYVLFEQPRRPVCYDDQTFDLVKSAQVLNRLRLVIA